MPRKTIEPKKNPSSKKAPQSVAPQNFFSKMGDFFSRIFRSQKPSSPSPKLPGTLPESIEEIRQIVDDLSEQIEEFSKENDELQEQLSKASRTNNILIIITVVSVITSLILIFQLIMH